MARQTWAEIKAEATIELRTRTDISSRVEGWLRQAFLEVAYGFRFYELESTKTFTLSVNASEISFTTMGLTNLKHVLSLKDTTNNRKVIPSSFRFIDKRNTGTGSPTHYCRFGNSLLFDSAPSSSGVEYRLRYRKQVTEPNFSSTSAYPDTPDEWDEVIRMKALVRGSHSLYEYEVSDLWEAKVNRLIAAIPIDETVESEDQDFGITPRI